MMRFLALDTGLRAGVGVKFDNPPTYFVGHCGTGWRVFTMPGEDKHRVWTITKTAPKLELFCNGVAISEIYFEDTSLQNCTDLWSLNFSHMKFVATETTNDTASDFFRQLPDGERIALNFIACKILLRSYIRIGSGYYYWF